MQLKRQFLIFFMLPLILIALFFSVSFAHLLVRANGVVHLSKAKNSEFHLTGPGERLGNLDILHPASGTKVYVFCDNMKVRSAIAGVDSGINAICPEDKQLGNIYALLRGEDSMNQAGGADPRLPYTISPRMTYLLTPRPKLRWNRVSGVSSYNVRILKRGGRILWQKTNVPATRMPMPYPDDVPPLKWRVKYLLDVETDKGASSLLDAGACYGFKVLDKNKIQKMKKKPSQIAGLIKLTRVEKAMVYVYLFSQKNLIGAALDKLKSLVEQGTRNAFVYRELGGLYAKAGLNLLAEDYYSKALALYQVDKDEYGPVKTQAELAVVKMNLGKDQEARRYADEAIVSLRNSGNTSEATELAQRLKVAERNHKQLAVSRSKGNRRVCGEIITPGE